MAETETANGMTPVRYAVVGLGHIAQAAVLPAFRHARENSRLVALVSGDADKLDAMKRRYRVRHAVPYEGYGDLLASGEIDAVYIALPNDLHHQYVLEAAAAGVHVLCEKPLGLTERECEEMVAATTHAGVKLMTAYRLHFDAANLEAMEIAQSGKLGELRFFASSFALRVEDRDNIRLSAERGGGPLFDLGIYCINAARTVFRAEPMDVLGMEAVGRDPRFEEVPEMSFALLRFPGERVATFGCSFGTADVSMYEVHGTRGSLRLEPAYDYAKPLVHHLTIDGKTTRKRFRKRDQFAPELLAFSTAVLLGTDLEPDGVEGLADVRIMRAIMRSAATGRVVTLPPIHGVRYPEPDQAEYRPPVRKPDEVKVESPRGG